MSIFSRFPYTDFHRLNADWILEKVKEAMDAVAESLGLVRQSAADAAAAAAAAEQAVDGSVRYDRVQQLTQAQQRQGQTNLNVVDASVTANIQLAVSDLTARTVQVDQPQTFTAQQQAQARANIGAASQADLNDDVEALTELIEMNSSQIRNCVRYDMSQVLTDAQKTQARANIGAAAEGSGPAPVGAVLYDQSQSLTTAQQLQARNNIGAASSIDLANVEDDVAGTVRFDGPQTITDSQAAQARENINMLAGVMREEIVTGTTPSIDLASLVDGTAYETVITCTGTSISTVTISTAVNTNLLATIVFTTGATAPTFDSPLSIRGLDDLVPEASTTYEISIRGNRAVWHSWEVSA